MRNFEFYNPTKLIFGKDKTTTIGEHIVKYGYKKVLLVYGSGSIKKNDTYIKITNSLKENNLEVTEFKGIKPNPDLAKVREGITLALENDIDMVLAVGGGSVIDSAKAVAAGYYLDDIWQAYEGKVEINKALPLFVILTISATGSEMNCFSVLTNEEENKKWSIANENIFPKLTIIDPSLQKSLPWKQITNGAVDALAHVMEYYSLGKDEETSLALNESLMRTIVKVTDQIKEDRNSYELRANLAWAATLALNGVSGAMLQYGDWSSHRIEHGISAFNNKINHGEGLAVVLPAWISYINQENKPLFKRWAKNVWNADSVDKALIKIKAKFKEWGKPLTLTDIGINEKDLDSIIKITMEKGVFGTVRKMNKEDVLKILRSVI